MIIKTWRLYFLYSADDIDEAAALEAQRKAEQALKDSNADIDYARAKVELAQAAAQLQALKKMVKRGR